MTEYSSTTGTFITLPVVPTDQNGSGVAATRKEYFDQYGNLTWSMDKRGFITSMKYDTVPERSHSGSTT